MGSEDETATVNPCEFPDLDGWFLIMENVLFETIKTEISEESDGWGHRPGTLLSNGCQY